MLLLAYTTYYTTISMIDTLIATSQNMYLPVVPGAGILWMGATTSSDQQPSVLNKQAEHGFCIVKGRPYNKGLMTFLLSFVNTRLCHMTAAVERHSLNVSTEY